MTKRNLFLFFMFCLLEKGICQSPIYSDFLIKYDLLNHTTDKPIPFDHPFTLTIEKLSSKGVKYIHVYGAKFKKGKRDLVKTRYRVAGSFTSDFIMDISLNWNTKCDTLQIFFPALKPNRYYDINVASNLSGDLRNSLMKANSLFADAKNEDAKKEYISFRNNSIDNFTNKTNVGLSDSEYLIFYNASLKVYYNNINTKTFSTTGSLKLEEIQAVDSASRKGHSDFNDGKYLIALINTTDGFRDVQNGIIDIKKIYISGSATEKFNLPKRSEFLKSNIIFFDSLLQRIDRIISRGNTQIVISSSTVVFKDLRKSVSDIKKNLIENAKFINEQLFNINNAIDSKSEIKQANYLVGNTVSSDLKTAGGSVLFVDAGLTNIFVQGLKTNSTSIPKFYSGISIYFRPIDKNTRSNKFPCKFDPTKHKGCTSGNCGPDYGIVSRWSIWQHLCLNLGFTLGGITNKDYENLYNNTSLLVGPAYRFKRAFKISGGASFLKRSTGNPLNSDKSTVVGGYVSLSVDVDFIQGVKDVYSIIFK